jgi:hypothetical protein
MFSDTYPKHGRLTMTACVRAGGDEALEWFCARHGIRVVVVST